MITLLELRERMEANPFKPFRLCTTDGRTYDITNHDMMFIKRNGVEVALDLDDHHFAERFSKIALPHITAIEDLRPVQPASI
jgi:hypothetical protein